jgi:coenzyme PQQ synthesis protein D (PqqD)
MTPTLLFDGRVVLRPAPNVVCRRVGGESILVPIRQNVGNLDYVYTLSAVAADVWALLDGTRPFEGIIDTICETYEVDRDTATADVTALVTDLLDVGLLSRTD